MLDISIADTVLYVLSIGLFFYSMHPKCQGALIHKYIIVSYIFVALINGLNVEYNDGRFWVMPTAHDSFHVYMGTGIMITAGVLLMMYRADKMRLGYYTFMTLSVLGAYLATGESLLEFLIGCIVIWYALKCRISRHINMLIRDEALPLYKKLQMYQNGLHLAIVCIVCGGGVMLYQTHIFFEYQDISDIYQGDVPVAIHLGGALVFCGSMALIGILPFSNAFINVHQLFLQPVVLILRLIIATAIVLSMGNMTTILFSHTLDTLWQNTFLYIGSFAMIISLIGSVQQYSLRRLYGYVALGHLGFLAVIMSMEQLESIDLAMQYAVGYVVSYMAFWAYARGAYVERKPLTDVHDLHILRLKKPYYTFCFCVTALCFSAFPPFALFWSKILVLSAPEYWSQWVFQALVGLVFGQGLWAVRFLYFTYMYEPDISTNRVAYTKSLSFASVPIRLILTILATIYVFM